MLILWLGFRLALAAPVVVAEGDAAEARAVVAEHLGVSPADVALVRPSEVRARQPWSDVGRVVSCQGPPARRSDIEGALERAVAGLLSYELETARAAIELAEAHVVCATDPADPELLWELFFVQGVLLVNLEDTATAHRAFRTARNLDSERPWNTEFPDSDGRDVFAAAADGETSRVVLAPTPAQLRVDAERVDLDRPYLDLPTGQHLLQFGASPMTTTVLFDPQNGAPTLVVPSLLPADSLAWTRDTLTHDLGAVLGRVLPADTELWVVDGRTLHHTPLGTLEWTESALPALPTPPPPPPDRPQWPHYVALGGAGAAGAGVVGIAATRTWASDLRERLDSAADPDEFSRLDERYVQARSWNRVSIGVTVTGVATAVIAEWLAR